MPGTLVAAAHQHNDAAARGDGAPSGV